MQTTKISQEKDLDISPPFPPSLGLVYMFMDFFLTTCKYILAAEYRTLDVSVCQEGLYICTHRHKFFSKNGFCNLLF